ncbi:MAG TPA: carboxypeptidase-like regulatory domain-containing protein [Bacteroidia bacterium]|nr:carboxypeptidase-like regulatory domain-containing protein [Bacteroidia bacterium]
MKTKIIIYIFLSISLIFLQNCSENPTEINNLDKSIINGTIVDNDNSLPIPGAKVTSLNSGITAFSDTNGYFSIKNITTGNHQFIISKFNYIPDTLNIAVTNNDTINFEIKLSVIDPFLDLKGDKYKITFTHLNSSTTDIFQINSDGTGFRKLTNNFNASAAIWSPDGSYIALVTNDDIFIMDSSSSNIYPLTNDEYWDHSVPWSPTGDKLVFVSNKNGNLDIYTINKDGTGRLQLTNNGLISPSANSYTPLWSPDGEYIAYSQFTDGIGEIYIMNSDGSNQRPLTTDGVYKTLVKWSPDSDKLLANYGEDDQSEIFLIFVNGSDPFQLTNNNSEDEATDWSLDGQKILFSSERDGSVDDIFIMNSDGSEPKNLTRTNNSAELWGKFSPDGLKIVYWSNRDIDGEIYLMNIQGYRHIRLINNPGADQWPNWCPVPNI